MALMSVALVTGQTARQSTPASTPAARPQARPAAAPDASTQRALLDQYCVTCHNARAKTANLLLDQLDLAHLGDQAEIGEKVVRKLRAGMMPPVNMKRPDASTLDGFVHWMEGELDRGAATHLPAPGLHRLNRLEYANAVRDLLGL